MKKLEWITIKVKVKDLIQLELNPRKISDEKRQKLIESLEKFNLVEIPAINTDMNIIGGNQRVMALMLVGRGEEEIDVRYPNRKLTPKEVKEYTIISNTHAGEFDFDMIGLEFTDVIDDIGFDIAGLEDWKAEVEDALSNEVKEDNYEIPEEIKTDIVLGDLFEIGEHRLLCGDSTDAKQVAKLMNNKKADMVFTDPPYGIDFQSNFRVKTQKFSKIKNDNVILDIAPILFLWLKNNCPVYVCTRWDLYPVWFNQIEKSFNIKNCIVWYKNGGGLGDLINCYSPNHEFIIVGHKGQSKLKGKRNTDVWEIKRDEVNSYKHPTQKPVELSSFALENHSKINDIIIDLFIGSASTMVASHQLQRKCYGMELEPKYCQVTIDRMLKLDPELTILKNGKPWTLNN